MVLVGIYGMQRDPALWEDALTFDPDRFSVENSRGRTDGNSSRSAEGHGHASVTTSPCWKRRSHWPRSSAGPKSVPWRTTSRLQCLSPRWRLGRSRPACACAADIPELSAERPTPDHTPGIEPGTATSSSTRPGHLIKDSFAGIVLDNHCAIRGWTAAWNDDRTEITPGGDGPFRADELRFLSRALPEPSSNRRHARGSANDDQADTSVRMWRGRTFKKRLTSPVLPVIGRSCVTCAAT